MGLGAQTRGGGAQQGRQRKEGARRRGGLGAALGGGGTSIRHQACQLAQPGATVPVVERCQGAAHAGLSPAREGREGKSPHARLGS